MLKTIIKLDDVSTGYNGSYIINNLSFEIRENETLVIIGQNGSGKSTILKTIARIISDNSGTITFNDINIKTLPPHKLRSIGISYFIQGGLVFNVLSVKEHFQLVLKGKSKERKQKLRDDCYEQFPELIKLNSTLGGNLSGGERQMLSFAMLISQETNVWLLDEPTAGLAPKIVNDVIGFLKKMQNNKTILLVEHNQKVISQLATRIINIDEFKI